MKIGLMGFYNPNRVQTKKLELEKNELQQTKYLQATSGGDVFVRNSNPISFGANFNQFKNIHGLHCPCCDGEMIPQVAFRMLRQLTKSENVQPSISIRQSRILEKKLNNHDKELLKQAADKTTPASMDLLEELIIAVKKVAPDKLNIFENFINRDLLKTENNQKIFGTLTRYKDILPNTEKMVLHKLSKAHEKYPEKTLRDLMVIMRPKELRTLDFYQLTILDELNLMATDLSQKSRVKLTNFVEESKKIIINENVEKPFKRKEFIDRFNDLTSYFPEKAVVKSLVEKATELPSSGNNVSAFIVKYSGNILQKVGENKIPVSATSHDIADRILDPVRMTIDHSNPLNPIEGEIAGLDDINNCLLMCKKCNNEKGNLPFRKWLRLHPEMIENVIKHLRKILELINSGKVKGFDDYPEGISKTLKESSRGRLKVDIHELNQKRYTAKTA